jgi:hypothetical protein
MVVEDVDLIAREREHMRHAVEEVLLNELLNEMDGLREDSDDEPPGSSRHLPRARDGSIRRSSSPCRTRTDAPSSSCSTRRASKSRPTSVSRIRDAFHLTV